MSRDGAARWITGTGLLMVVAGVGFLTERPPQSFVSVGDGLCVVGALCFLIPGWLYFGRKSDAWF
jgi:hypothetical protein